MTAELSDLDTFPALSDLPIVLMHVVWMADYQGPEEVIHAGGFKHPLLYGWGGEMFNFKPFFGRCYGHVEMMGKNIDITKNLHAAKNEDKIDGFLVVWTAPVAEEGGRAVVGWYRNAMIHRERQTPTGVLGRVRTHREQICHYHVEADAKDCVCVPENLRTCTIPSYPSAQKGVPGQSPVFYLENYRINDGPASEAAKIEHNIRNFIASYTGLSVADSLAASGKRAQPRTPNAERRKAVELAAMDIVTSYFSKNYLVENVSDENFGYDLVAVKKDDPTHILCIEVKGRSGTDITADFSVNEYAKIRLEEKGDFDDGSYRICIVTDALNVESGSELHHFRFRREAAGKGEWRGVGNRKRLGFKHLTAARGSLKED
jgi:hypothetical protein